MTNPDDAKPLCDLCDSEPSVVEVDGCSVTSVRRMRRVISIGDRCVRELARLAGYDLIRRDHG